jgi:hypothetical protein
MFSAFFSITPRWNTGGNYFFPTLTKQLMSQNVRQRTDQLFIATQYLV